MSCRQDYQESTCQCLSTEEAAGQAGYRGGVECNEECMNRMLLVECTTETCRFAREGKCLNQRMQRRQVGDDSGPRRPPPSAPGRGRLRRTGTSLRRTFCHAFVSYTARSGQGLPHQVLRIRGPRGRGHQPWSAGECTAPVEGGDRSLVASAIWCSNAALGPGTGGGDGRGADLG